MMFRTEHKNSVVCCAPHILDVCQAASPACCSDRKDFQHIPQTSGMTPGSQQLLTSSSYRFESTRPFSHCWILISRGIAAKASLVRSPPGHSSTLLIHWQQGACQNHRASNRPSGDKRAPLIMKVSGRSDRGVRNCAFSRSG